MLKHTRIKWTRDKNRAHTLTTFLFRFFRVHLFVGKSGASVGMLFDLDFFFSFSFLSFVHFDVPHVVIASIAYRESASTIFMENANVQLQLFFLLSPWILCLRLFAFSCSFLVQFQCSCFITCRTCTEQVSLVNSKCVILTEKAFVCSLVHFGFVLWLLRKIWKRFYLFSFGYNCVRLCDTWIRQSNVMQRENWQNILHQWKLYVSIEVRTWR